MDFMSNPQTKTASKVKKINKNNNKKMKLCWQNVGRVLFYLRGLAL